MSCSSSPRIRFGSVVITLVGSVRSSFLVIFPFGSGRVLHFGSGRCPPPGRVGCPSFQRSDPLPYFFTYSDPIPPCHLIRVAFPLASSPKCLLPIRALRLQVDPIWPPIILPIRSPCPLQLQVNGLPSRQASSSDKFQSSSNSLGQFTNPIRPLSPIRTGSEPAHFCNFPASFLRHSTTFSTNLTILINHKTYHRVIATCKNNHKHLTTIQMNQNGSKVAKTSHFPIIPLKHV